ncbi:MAG: MarR family transcriptional regulator [Saprospiraceae bacterium]|nr:MarR family transcriptional regulator [Saprospiraceae bacterium]
MRIISVLTIFMAFPTAQRSIQKRYEVSGFAIEKTVKLMKLSFSRILLLHPEIDITVDQWIIIQLLHKHTSLSQQELSDLAFKDAPTITRMIDLMVQKNLATRNPDSNDRRKFIISLTNQGIFMYKQVSPVVNEFRAEAYADISNEELATLEKIMNKIFLNLSKQN